MKYEQPTLELIELKIKDVMTDSDKLIDGGEGDGESGEFGEYL